MSTVFFAQDASFRRGDANQDATLDITDVIFTLRYLFLSSEEPQCLDALDSNDDGGLDISDPVFSLLYLFTGGNQPPAPGDQCGGDPSPDRLGCAAYRPCQKPPILGQSEFMTRTAGAPPGGSPRMGGVDAEFGGPAPPAANPDPGTPEPQERLIEESDIYKLSGNNLFVLNRYRGLQVIDFSDLDRPELIGRAPIFGYPREMYVRDTLAFVIVSDYFTIWRDRAAEIMPSSFYGSQLRIIDVADPRNPQVIGGIELEGDVTDSRIVGDVMYLVSQRYSWYWNADSDDNVDRTRVLSVTIGDPANIKVVDFKDFPRNGLEHHIYVSQKAIFLASSGYQPPEWNQFLTTIRYIDISDPAGMIKLRGEATAPGRVQDRWSLDEYQDALRVASSQFWGNGDVYLTTFSVSNPDQIRKLGSYTLRVSENLTSARFDGTHGYLVTYRNIDPLFVFDLADPAKPALLGELEMTGWLDFMVPQGDRIVALGHEDRTNPDGSRSISLAVSLVDVSPQGPPRLLSRVSLDGMWGWVPSGRDDFAKVFKVLKELGLVMFPFQAWSQTDYQFIGGVQLIDWKDDTLVRRGLIRNAGMVERGISHGASTVFTLSPEVFQVLDIADRDNPRLRGRLELARNVQDFALLPGPHTVQLAGDWYLGNFQLLTTPIEDPDAPEPLGKISIPAPYGRLFVNEEMAYVSSVQEMAGTDGQTSRATHIQVVDLADPAQPKLRGEMALPEEVWLGYRGWFWGTGDEVVQVNGSTLAFHRYRFYFIDCLGCPVALDAKPGIDPNTDNAHKIYLADLKDPDGPVLAATVVLDDFSWAWGLKASGTTLYLSTYRTRQETDFSWTTRFYLIRIDVADPANPIVHPEVNIPGIFVDATPDGQYIYTQETQWDATGGQKTFFFALALIGDQAHLQSKVELPGYVNSLQVKGNGAFATTQIVESIIAGGGTQWKFSSLLVTVDLSDPQALQLAGRAEIPMDYAYLQKVEAGRAFLGSYAGILVYRTSDLSKPTFEEFFRTQGWSQDIVVRGNKAFIPSGYYGIQVLNLKD
ncbi:MAG: beta-propeller domain-containing protein [Planctomycetes bacterium]|nr:beta-propeller domain-containing protein [Planctomycetota bacterium]